MLRAARDLSDRRAELWPDVHVEHLQVHNRGAGWAEVTEGNPWPIGFVWERLRYDWNEDGCLKGTVLDSNIFKPGSTWELRCSAREGGGRESRSQRFATFAASRAELSPHFSHSGSHGARSLTIYATS